MCVSRFVRHAPTARFRLNAPLNIGAARADKLVN